MKGIKVYKLQKNKNNPNLIIGELKKNLDLFVKDFFLSWVIKTKLEVTMLIKNNYNLWYA